ncbi:metalloregulator ArsR/SmtB family transcription factor [Rubrivirga sp. S365]|uniref:ArsR/SmtB family transcription factor n=1 Tax=Rubrivirga sp. S365 TaxID=3076080 RepID=UPI0028C6F2B3|nr:metalloregulator ArsR/SmtB family transcription factor [Rubrivirga sp. S365]MDT7858388.1 metalloregulator ArsR/SmtB family transcription factor [Rubrivirga sp. S365]
MKAKTDLFPPDLARLAGAARALGHPARLAILQTLAERDACVCGELVEALPLAQATVSQHLAALKAAGLVRGEVDGPRSCYCVDGPALRALADGLAGFLDPVLAALPATDAADCC